MEAMQPDRELLNEFTRSRSEEAFRALVDRHVDLVHSVARRVTLNDELARDVSQAVFLKLATRPDDVPHDIKLLAWLHRTTRHKAIDLVRSENRRRRREHFASEQQKIDMEKTEELDWKVLEPVLDGALAKLSETDRTLILARYYRKHSHASTAQELGISEDAARMRTKRALEKLRGALGRRGIATTSALLASVVSTNAVTPAPPSLAASISSTTLATANAGGSFLALAKLYSAVVAIIAVSIPIFALQLSRQSSLEAEASKLRSTVASLGGSDSTSTAKRTRTSARGRDRMLSLEQILAIPDPQERLGELLKFSNSVRPAQIPSAIADLHAITPDWDQDAKVAIQLLYTRWGRSDLNSALDHVEELDFKLAGDEIAIVVAALAAEDPQRAADWLSAPENKLGGIPVLNQQLAGAVGKEWARQSPGAAVDWALELDDPMRRGAMAGVLGTLTATHHDLLPSAIESWQSKFPSEASQSKFGSGH